MTTDKKLRYIDSFYRLIVTAQTYRDAIAHANFTRGVLAAYWADMSVSLEDYKRISGDIEVVLEVKRNLPVEGDVV